MHKNRFYLLYNEQNQFLRTNEARALAELFSLYQTPGGGVAGAEVTKFGEGALKKANISSA